MKFLKNLFKPKVKYQEWDVHNVELFNDIPSFYDRIKDTKEFDKRYIYYYRGESSNLKNLIANPYNYGEKEIRDISLEFIGVDVNNVDKKQVIFNQCLFFSDVVRQLKTYNPYFSFIYRNDDGHVVTLNKVLIAKNAVYFCSK